MKKTKAVFAVLFSALLLGSCMALVACDKGLADETGGGGGGGGGGGVYKITLDANGGTITNDVTEVSTSATGKLLTIPSAVTHATMDFKEWNTDKDGDGDKITTEYVFTGDTTIYAQWKEKGSGDDDDDDDDDDNTTTTYTVTFDLNGGKVGISTENVVVKTTSQYLTAEQIPTPTLEGSEFKGWTTVKNSGTPMSNSALEAAKLTSTTTTYYAYYSTTPDVGNVRIPSLGAAFVFDDGTLVIQLEFIPSWGDPGTAFAFDPGTPWESRYALDGSSTYTISGSMSSKSFYIGFTENGTDGKNTNAIPCSKFTPNKINIVKIKNAAGDDCSWADEGDAWYIQYTIVTEDY